MSLSDNGRPLHTSPKYCRHCSLVQDVSKSKLDLATPVTTLVVVPCMTSRLAFLNIAV